MYNIVHGEGGLCASAMYVSAIEKILKSFERQRSAYIVYGCNGEYSNQIFKVFYF